MLRNPQMLDKERLAQHRKHLEDEIVRLKLFSDLGRAPEGRFVLDWIDGRLRDLCGFYASIPAHDARAPTVLAGIQAAEAELCALRDRIKDADKYKIVLEQQLMNVVRLGENKERPAQTRGGQLIPDAIRSKDA